jgi:protein gp37
VGDKSGIQWTDATWNPTYGCTKVSPGCAQCYISRTPPYRIQGLQFVRGHIPLQLHHDRLDVPLRWKRPRRIFVNSLSDLFHADVPDAFVDKVFAVMALCPQHTFQVLTKRPERMRDYCSDVLLRQELIGIEAERMSGTDRHILRLGLPEDGRPRWPLPLPNVWLGPSVENRPMGDRRFPIAAALCEAGWNVMVSMEPLLQNVDIPQRLLALGRRVWVIVGGESATVRSEARPFCLSWARNVVHDCEQAGVPCHVKQLGSRPYETTSEGGMVDGYWPVGRWLQLRQRQGGDMAEWPEYLRVRQFPGDPVPAGYGC